MAEPPWMMRIENGLAAHFKQAGGPSRPGVLWAVGLKRGEETYTVTVKALLSEDASAATRADQEYQARTTMQYLGDQLARGWHPSAAREHVIDVGDPPQAVPARPGAKPWWKFW